MRGRYSLPHWAAVVAVVALTLAPPTWAGTQVCPNVPDTAFTFIGLGSNPCPPNPGVRWANANVIYDCSYLADAGTLINCSGDPGTCVDLCRTAASSWNTGLPDRFTLINATDSAAFCDPNDGRVSVGGTSALCDGTTYGSRVLAVTLSVFFSSGQQAGELIDANITINKSFAFSQGGFQATLAHEFGHVLGLSHPDECGDDFNVLMRSASLLGPQEPCFVLNPTKADINGAQRIYPVIRPALCGDADLSGTLTVTDGVQALRAAAELSSTCTPARCDVDGNGAISVTDGVNVLRGAAGLPFPANCP